MSAEEAIEAQGQALTQKPPKGLFEYSGKVLVEHTRTRRCAGTRSDSRATSGAATICSSRP